MRRVTSQALHQRLQDCAANLPDAPLSFAQLAQLAQLQGRSMQGTVLVLLAAPCALPVPGIGNVLGLAMVVMASALWRGDDCSHLPQRIARLQLPARCARRVLRMLAWVYALANRWSRQRLCHIAVVRPRRSWLAGKLGLMGVVIFLPIPFGNVLPALAVVLLGLGLALRDGLAVLLAAVVAVVATAAGRKRMLMCAALDGVNGPIGLAEQQDSPLSQLRRFSSRRRRAGSNRQPIARTTPHTGRQSSVGGTRSH